MTFQSIPFSPAALTPSSHAAPTVGIEMLFSLPLALVPPLPVPHEVSHTHSFTPASTAPDLNPPVWEDEKTKEQQS